jgi:nucleotide-binding universal stress UspA family protein
MLMVIEEKQVDFWGDTEFYAGTKRPQIHLKKESRIYQQAEKILKNLSKRVPANVKCREKILTGDPSKVILNYSKRKKPSIIILGSRGIGGFSKLLLGSVSDKVVEHSTSSILIVK